MKPTTIRNFGYMFYGPMTRQLFAAGDLVPQTSPSTYYGIGSGSSRAMAITRAIGDFRDTPAATLANQITDRVQMNLKPEWQQEESSEEDGTEMFCVIEIGVE
jgi:hypothetical protein